MVELHPVECPTCKRKFKSTSGPGIECPECTIKSADMTKSPYMTRLIAFLTIEMVGKVTVIRIEDGLTYRIFIAQAGVKKQFGEITFSPYEDDVTIRIAIASIRARDPADETSIKKFIKSNGNEALIVK